MKPINLGEAEKSSPLGHINDLRTSNESFLLEEELEDDNDNLL